ncbi:MAG: ABC transporter permease, partial [Planctomycetota bacterium]|nr:ABC transporter permease [Planctomycetota bacterium]
MIRNLFSDLKLAFRTLKKAPGFTIIAVLTLALGIGLNAAIFSLVNTIIFRPLPYAHADEIVQINRIDSSNPDDLPSFSYPDYLEYRDKIDAFRNLAAVSYIMVSVGHEDAFEMNIGQIVSGNFFDVFNVHPVLGRLITPSDDVIEGNHPVVVLSYKYWQRKYDGDPAIVGSVLMVNGHAFTVIGVTPEDFAGALPAFESNLYVPMMQQAQVFPIEGGLMNRADGWLDLVVGRLKPEMTVEQAQALADLATVQMKDVDPKYANEQAIIFKPMGMIDSPKDRPALYAIAAIIMSMVGLVLLIVCANVANLFLAKSLTRRKEIAIQLALGSGRFRLVRQLLVEALIVALAGGLLGTLIAAWSVYLFNALLPQLPFNISLNLEFALDSRMLAYTCFASIGTGIVFGLFPALQTTKTDLLAALKSDSDSGDTFRGSKLRNVLVVSQVAISMVLLVGAGLFERSLFASRSLDPGFEHENVLAVSMDLTMMRLDENTGAAFYEDSLDRVRELPGVESACIDVGVPLGFLR